MGDVTHLKQHWWKPGQSGNPAGQKPGVTRRVLSDQFFQDCFDAWKEKGRDVIDKTIKDNPGLFLKIIASLMPRQLDVDNPDLTRDRIRRAIAICEQLESAIAGSGSGDSEPGTTVELPPVPETT